MQENNRGNRELVFLHRSLRLVLIYVSTNSLIRWLFFPTIYISKISWFGTSYFRHLSLARLYFLDEIFSSISSNLFHKRDKKDTSATILFYVFSRLSSSSPPPFPPTSFTKLTFKYYSKWYHFYAVQACKTFFLYVEKNNSHRSVYKKIYTRSYWNKKIYTESFLEKRKKMPIS